MIVCTESTIGYVLSLSDGIILRTFNFSFDDPYVTLGEDLRLTCSNCELQGDYTDNPYRITSLYTIKYIREIKYK